MATSYDVIIVGGGIMGCSSAWHLAQRGQKIAVFEKGTLGEGPSGKSSAIIRQHYSNEITARMALYSLRFFQNFEQILGESCGFQESGFVVMVEEKDRAGLEANIAFQQGLGIQTEMISADTFRELMPGAIVDDQLGIALEQESGYVDPYLTVTAFARGARGLGVDIFQDTPVTDIHFRSGQVTGVETPDESYSAPIVINCAGAWGARVARMADVSLPVNSCRVQVSFFRRPPEYSLPHPVVADFVNATYFRSETGGLTLVGLIDPEEAKAIVDPDRFDQDVDSDFILDSGERLISRFPVMERSLSTGGYASLYGITPDWHPVIDQVPANSGFYVCSGFSGHGFKLGPAVGRTVADLVMRVDRPEFDTHMFRLNRFAENDPVRGQYEYSIVG